MLIDTHCHLDDPRFNNERRQVIERAWAEGLDKMITIGCNLENAARARDLAIVHKNIYFSAGIHPHDADNAPDGFVLELEKLALHRKCVAIGECGLDYYYEHSSKETQANIFRHQIKLAIKLRKTLVVHVRDAWEDCFSLLEASDLSLVTVVIHCFTGSMEFAKKCVELGFFLSIPGVLTFKNSGELPQVVKEVPLERLIVETDSPYLAPVPFRGKRNEPAHVRKVVEKIAELRSINIAEVLEITGENAIKIFSLPKH